MDADNAILEERLKRYRLPNPLMTHPGEERLPFGVMRRLPPLSVSEADIATAMTMLHQKTSRLPLERIREPPMATIKPANIVNKPQREVIFRPFNMIPTSREPKTSIQSVASVPQSNVLYFDPSLLVFYKPNPTSINPTIISSNAGASVTGDRQHFAAVLTNGCLLVDSPAAFSLPQLPPTQNNKLKLLKCAEYLAREWPQVFSRHTLGLAVMREERAILSPHPNRLTVIGSSSSNNSNNSNGLNWAILKADGRILTNTSLPFQFDAQEGDWIVLIRVQSRANRVDWPRIASILRASSILDDLEGSFESVDWGITGMVASRLGRFGDFEGAIERLRVGGPRLQHSFHLDSRLGALTEAIEPGRFGSTTRHCVIYRPGHLAALHHDASKINRFGPTIDYILKKLLHPRLGVLDLSRISEIQYWAYVYVSAGEALVAVGGGAIVIALLDVDVDDGEGRVVFEDAGVICRLPAKSVGVLLLSPQLAAFKHAAFNGDNVKSVFEAWCRGRGIDFMHPKLSCAYFQIKRD